MDNFYHLFLYMQDHYVLIFFVFTNCYLILYITFLFDHASFLKVIFTEYMVFIYCYYCVIDRLAQHDCYAAFLPNIQTASRVEPFSRNYWKVSRVCVHSNIFNKISEVPNIVCVKNVKCFFFSSEEIFLFSYGMFEHKYLNLICTVLFV